ncbi:hypothetical protein [Mycoplasma amphoriforme]|uniref:ABC transporter domain-containing protein n=1 Tax=Mycoplasma amphoriforme A39 TaxID=572419 RepID=A0A292II66_9MOLU|nr:unnamed protein product [Mycoplasma amphoriforme A39]
MKKTIAKVWSTLKKIITFLKEKRFLAKPKQIKTPGLIRIHKIEKSWSQNTEINTNHVPFAVDEAFKKEGIIINFEQISSCLKWSWKSFLKPKRLFKNISLKIYETNQIALLSNDIHRVFELAHILDDKQPYLIHKKLVKPSAKTKINKIKRKLTYEASLTGFNTVSDLINYVINLAENRITKSQLSVLVTTFGLELNLLDHPYQLDLNTTLKLKILLKLLLAKRLCVLDEIWYRIPIKHRQYLLNIIDWYVKTNRICLVLCSNVDEEIQLLTNRIILIGEEKILVDLTLSRYLKIYRNVDNLLTKILI